jgi:hypothetical protein
LSNESQHQDPGRAIMAVIFMILSCGGGIGWRIYKCHRDNKRRKFIQPRLPYPNSIYTKSILTPTLNRSNEIGLRETYI